MQLFIAFDWECGFAIQPKAIGCFPVMALQAVSHNWMEDVATCVDFLREELSWRDAMDRLLYQMTHEFDPDFKEFIPIYLERYIVFSEMPTSRGALAALESVSHWVFN